jgi:TM2 domain.
MANQLLAAIFSFFIPGLGQFYAGSFLRGVLVFISALILGFISLVTIIFWIVYIIFFIWNIVDAVQLAGKKVVIMY